MAQLLIRDVPDDVVAAVDAHAGRLGLSRSEYLRRRLSQEARLSTSQVTADDLQAFADTFSDLADGDVIRSAWS